MKTLNAGIKAVYALLAAIPVRCGSVALYSCCSVLRTFGKAGSEDVVAQMARETGKTIVLFPREIGEWFRFLEIINRMTKSSRYRCTPLVSSIDAPANFFTPPVPLTAGAVFLNIVGNSTAASISNARCFRRLSLFHASRFNNISDIAYAIHVRDTMGLNIDEFAMDLLPSADSIVFTIADKTVYDNRLSVNGYVLPADSVNTIIQATYHQPWNRDNFGPLTLPADTCFLLGDNRSQAFDSRYFGPVKREQLIGSVCWD